jgi:hypothetical protein
MAFGSVFVQTKPNPTNPVRIWGVKIRSGLDLGFVIKNRPNPVKTKPNRPPNKGVIIFDKIADVPAQVLCISCTLLTSAGLHWTSGPVKYVPGRIGQKPNRPGLVWVWSDFLVSKNQTGRLCCTGTYNPTKSDQSHP